MMTYEYTFNLTALCMMCLDYYVSVFADFILIVLSSYFIVFVLSTLHSLVLLLECTLAIVPLITYFSYN